MFWPWIWSDYFFRSDWAKVSAFDTVTQIVCRTSHRIFVGLPLCGYYLKHCFCQAYTSDYKGRNPDWIALNIKFPTVVMKAAFIINLFPNFLKPWVLVCFLVGNWSAILVKDQRIIGRLLKPVDVQIQSGMRHLAPITEERQRRIREYGKEWEDKPVRSVVFPRQTEASCL